MRILVVTYEFPPVGGGGGSVARDISLELSRRGHQVRVLTSHYKGLARQENLQNVQINRVFAARRMLYKADLLTMMVFVFSGLIQGSRMVRWWKPDLIHVHFAVPSGPVAWFLSRVEGIPYVLTAHLGDVPGGVPEKTNRWFRWVYPFSPPIWKDAASVTAVSEYTRQLAAQSYPVDIRVIPNGVNLDQIHPGEIVSHAPPQIFFAGRFAEQKNPLQVVRTLISLRDLNWCCVMAGDGPLRTEIEIAIQKSGLSDRFRLPGWITPEEVIQHMSKSDILFMPSRSEGLPVVGVQSLAMGLCIVSSKIGGMLDVIDHGRNGYLIDPDEPEGYQAALSELLSTPSRLTEFRRASLEKAREFDIQHVVASYEAIFQAVLEGKREGG